MPVSRIMASLVALEPHVLVGRPWRHRHQIDGVLRQTRANGHQGAEVHDRREHRPVDRELLDPVQQRLALAHVTLTRLLLEQIVDVRIAAVGVAAFRVHELLHPAGRVPRIAHPDEEQAAQLLLAPGGVEGRALHRPHPHADADRIEVVYDRFRRRGETRDRRELPGVQSFGVPGFGEQLPALFRVVRWRLDLQRKVHHPRHDDARRRAKAQTRGLVDRLTVDRVVDASRSRLSCHGDFGSHCSVNSIQKMDAWRDASSVRRGSRLTSSPSGPSSAAAMSASPFFNIATRVVPSGTLLMTRRLIDGTLRQYAGYASSTTSTPGVWLTNLYGPAPMGCLRNPSSPTCVTYFFGTTSPAAVAVVP